MELPKNIRINEYTIKLIEEKQLSYGPIYTLSLVELETLKVYIETYLKTRFIWPSTFPTDTPIFFNKKPNSNFCLFLDYQGLNNLTIKNLYLFPLIKKALNCLGWAKQFTQLDLTYTYYQIKIWESDK